MYTGKSKVRPAFNKTRGAGQPQVSGNTLLWSDVMVTAEGERQRSFTVLVRVAQQPPAGVASFNFVSYLAQPGVVASVFPHFANNVTLTLVWK